MTDQIKDKITGFFYETPTEKSWTRLKMSIIIAVGLLIALIEIIAHIFVESVVIHETLILGLVGIGAGAKVTQKFAEMMKKKKDSNNEG